MAINFPPTPVFGEQFTVGGMTWQWDGAKWIFAPTPVAVESDETGVNRIINGDMLFDQRNNGGVVTTGLADAYFLDRWVYHPAGTTTGTAGVLSIQQQATGGPALDNVPLAEFPFCLRVQTTTASSGPNNANCNVSQLIEANALSDLGWGTPNAKPITLSFWFCRAATLIPGVGTMWSGAIRNTNAITGVRSYPFSFTPTNTGVWQKFVIQIPGDTTGAWTSNGNGTGLQVCFCLGGAGNNLGVANTWSAGNFFGVTGTTNIHNVVTSLPWAITGVKLETGRFDDPQFPRDTTAKRLSDCRRYYQLMQGIRIFYTAGAINETKYWAIQFSDTMRAAPTMTFRNQVNNPTGIPQTLTAISSDLNAAAINSMTNLSGGPAGATFTAVLNAEL